MPSWQSARRKGYGENDYVFPLADARVNFRFFLSLASSSSPLVVTDGVSLLGEKKHGEDDYVFPARGRGDRTDGQAQLVN